MNKIWDFFLDKYRLTYLLIVAIIIFGFISVNKMPKEANPDVEIPIGIVSTIYSGASPSDVEDLVTDEIEDKIADLDDLDEYTSTSNEGVSILTVQFDVDSDIDDRIRALKDAVSEAEPNLPDEAETPVVKQISLSDMPVLVLSLSADLESDQLKSLAEKVQDIIEKISGVSEVKLIGAYDREIQVVADQLKLDLYGIKLTELISAIQSHNIELPSGAIEQNGFKYNVRFSAEVENVEQLKKIPVKILDETPIFLADVADIFDGIEEPTTISRLGLSGKLPTGAVALEIYKKSGGDVLRIVDEVNLKTEELRDGLLQNAEIYVTTDNAKDIREDLGTLMVNGFETIVIVAFVLFMFLGWKEALIAGLSVPLTFFVTFTILSYLGYTFNFLTLFSLILALGILVDSAIVITEGMHQKIKQGMSPKKAAKQTVKAFQWPVISGTLTTVSAFLPMMLTGGIIGKFIRSIPVTVSVVLFSSLFVAMGIIPVIGSKILSKDDEDKKAKLNKYFEFLSVWYEKKLMSFLESNKRKKRILKIMVILLFLSFFLPASGLLKSVMFPKLDSDSMFVNVELTEGIVLEKTDKIVGDIERILAGDKRIVSFVSSVGSGAGQAFSASASNSHLANLTVNFDPDKKETSEEIIIDYRRKFSLIKEADITLTQEAAGPPQGSPVSVSFRGEDLDILQDLARKGEDILKGIKGASEVQLSFNPAPMEFTLSINRAKVEQLELSPMEIARILRASVQGLKSSVIKMDGDDIDVIVKLKLNALSSDPFKTREANINSVLNMMIEAKKGRVPLSALVNVNMKSGTTAISHDEGQRIVRLNAETEGKITVKEILKNFEEEFKEKVKVPEKYSVSYEGESSDMQESFSDMYRSLFIGVFIIAAILLLQFNSYRQPLFILMTLPLALIGVFPGLSLVRQPLSFPALIGIVALAGIVVNNAILLIDQINVNRFAGNDMIESIKNAALSRLKPIVLTTITTVTGILPLALSDPIWGPLGFSIVFGLIFSTILTLIVVPILYQLWAEKDLKSELDI